jgi:hypothetical protein
MYVHNSINTLRCQILLQRSCLLNLLDLDIEMKTER